MDCVIVVLSRAYQFSGHQTERGTNSVGSRGGNMCCIHVMLHNPLSANLIAMETTKVIFKCFATEPHLA